MEKTYIIYTISLQGKVMYIGKTCRFTKRKYNHLNVRDGLHSAIPADIDLDLIEFNVIDKVVGKDEALRVEGRYILEYKTLQEKGGWNKQRSGCVSGDSDYMKNYYKTYREQHKDKINQYKNEWSRTHRELKNKTQQKYREKNREERNRKQREYRARKKAEKLLLQA